MLRTRYLLLGHNTDTGEEPQPLSGLPDPRAKAQACEGGSREEQALSLEMRVREASVRGAVPSLLARGIVISRMGQAIKEWETCTQRQAGRHIGHIQAAHAQLRGGRRGAG